ncbi:hypothetical protein DFH09DRAFT_1339786 [Mycena vulgaris]|nr:hypothetical protein DFH09DRAFT_1339786 [Mycena vulgaris]
MSTTQPLNPSPLFDWGVPGVPVPLPPSRNPISPEIPASTEFKFEPIGAYNIRRYLGAKMPDFNRQRHRYLSSDVAWLASGSSGDNHHLSFPNAFFPEFHNIYDALPKGEPGQLARKEWAERVRRVIWDLATKYDRTTAGTTFIVHVAGTTVPGAPLAPERLKANVYLPPHFLADHPEVHPTVAFLVQTVIEQIGIPTASDWRRKALQLWSLNQSGRVGAVTLLTALIPAAVNERSSQYIFPGRPWGQLILPAPTPGPAQPGLFPDNEDDLAIFDIDDIMRDEDLIEAIMRADRAEADNRELRATVSSLQVHVATMQSDFQDRERVSQAELELMTTQVLRLENDLRVARVSLPSRAPSTPSRRPPPAYVLASPARLGSPSPALGFTQPLASSWRGDSSDASPATVVTPNTDEFLEFHGLMELSLTVSLIMRYVAAVEWKAEVTRLPELSAALADGLVKVMDEDRRRSL